MAFGRGRQNNARVFIYNLPYNILNTVSMILDTNNKWKELVTPLGFTVTDLYRFERCFLQGSSPSQTMIVEWGQQNHTIDELFCVLSKLRQRRAMSNLREYVSPKYHHLLDFDEPVKSVTETCQVLVDDLPKPPLPSCASKLKRVPMQETAYGTAFGNQSINSHESYERHTKQNGMHELDIQLSKLKVDPQNLNQPDSNASLPSKMGLQCSPCYNVSPQEAALHPSYPHLPNSYSELVDESMEDNTKMPTSSHSSLHERAEIWQHPQQQNQRPSVASSSKSRESGIQSFADNSMLTCIHYDAMIAATDNFANERVLGRGGFGVVYEGNWKNTKVAIKRIKKQANPGSTSIEDAKLLQSYAELQTLYKYRHDNILPLYGYSEQPDGLCLVYQFMVNGSLEDRLLRKNDTKPLTWRQRLNIARGSACGIQFLHTCDKDKPIIHGDIKSANILLDINLEPKIGDFGLAREGPSSQKTHRSVSAVHGTELYLPEDYIRSRKLSIQVDTYSFGIVLFELATGQRAYDKTRHRHPHLRDYVIEYEPIKYDNLRDSTAGDEWTEAFLEFVQLGSKCAASSKKDRPEMVQVLVCLENKLRLLERKKTAISPGAVENACMESGIDYSSANDNSVSLSNPNGSPLSLASEVENCSNSFQRLSQSSSSDVASIKEINCDVPPPSVVPGNIPNLTILGTKPPS